MAHQTDFGYAIEMLSTENFSVTEAGMRAVLDTMTNMNHAITHLSREVEAQAEALVVLHARLALVENAG